MREKSTCAHMKMTLLPHNHKYVHKCLLEPIYLREGLEICQSQKCRSQMDLLWRVIIDIVSSVMILRPFPLHYLRNGNTSRTRVTEAFEQSLKWRETA